MRLDPEIAYRNDSGTLASWEGSSLAGFGAIVRDDIARRAPTPKVVGGEFTRVLQSSRSFWPSTGFTRNRGPWAQGISARSFRLLQGRSARGRFTPWQLVNDALNERGLPYAGFVDRGIRAGAVRKAANFRAVGRTYDSTIAGILARLVERSRQSAG